MGTGVSSSRVTLSEERPSRRPSSRPKENNPRKMSQLSSTSAQRERSRSPTPRGTPRGSGTTTPQESPRPGSKSIDGEDHEITKAELESKSLDLMISYSHADKEMMNKIKENLDNNGIKVWVDVIGLGAGVDFLSKIGQAIIDAKLFISLLSEKSVESKYCQDELALAYISNKPIIPVGLAEREKLIPKMDTGMRLQLAGFHWTMFLEPNKFDESFHELLSSIQDALEKQKTDAERQNEQKDQKASKSGASKKPAPLERQSTRYRFYTRTSSNKECVGLSDKQRELPESFWNRNFKTADEIPYDKFVETVKREYKAELDDMYNIADQAWLMNLLRRELEVDDDETLLKDYFITKEWLIGFCTVDDVVCPLWVRIEDQARESYAMREVFNMESSVRVEAIENLGKFKSFAVIDALRDLLDDHEPNVRTVAAVSLAKTGATDKHTIKKLLRTLNDKDRLVREAGCIALGRLKAEHAVPRLVHIWRNDVISSVRDAAGLALEQIGGPQAEKAIHITKILAEEIRMLAKHS